MSIGSALSAAAMLTLLSGSPCVRADDYLVQVGGTDGIPFGGTCLVVVGDSNTKHEAIGTVPLTLAFSGDLISCAIIRKAGAGHLRVVIKNTAGRLVAESSDIQPFGVVAAGGR